MRLSLCQWLSDWKTMEQYVCERIPSDGIRVVLAAGEEGESWADLSAVWVAGRGWELHMERSDEGVDLDGVYDHFRRREMTWREWHWWFSWATRPLDGHAPTGGTSAEAMPSDSALASIDAKLARIIEATDQLRIQQREAGQAVAAEGATLTKKEVARRFQVSTRTIDRWRSMEIDLGEININGTPRFSPEKIAGIVATQKVRRRRKTK